MAKRPAYLAQVNAVYGRNAFLPHSAGMLQAYAQAQPDIKAAYDFQPLIFLREDPEALAAAMEAPDVLGLSCYVWSWEWNVALARAVRRRYPHTLIVLGGPHVPERDDGFFWRYPEVDVLVHHEGEIPFAEVLRRHAAGQDSTGIPGVCVQGILRATLHGPPAERPADLAALPSPYLAGVYEGLFAAHPDLAFHATSETHRGCPYSCAFCDWGSATFQKVRRFPRDRILEEFDWMGRHRIELYYNADANFGLFPDDGVMVERLVETKHRYGYPQQVRAAWAKNSNARVFALAKMLNDAGMDKGVTLSRQSMDEDALRIIKRTNIPMTTFAALVKQYTDAGIPTYTELIMGLPGETYDSWADGINTVLEAGQHNGLNIYLLAVLPNAELASPAYSEEWGLVTVRTPLLQQHAAPGADPIVEYQDIVIGTAAMPPEDWLRTYLFSWAVQTFHTLGLLQDIAIHLHDNHGVSYRRFYEDLIAGAASHERSIVGRAYAQARTHAEEGMHGGAWGAMDPRYGSVTWPLEEFSFLEIVTLHLAAFYAEIYFWCLDRWPGLVSADLVTQQAESMRTPEEYDGDVEAYARQVLAYGRKSGRFRKVNREVAS